jgi:hypothetical protein
MFESVITVDWEENHCSQTSQMGDSWFFSIMTSMQCFQREAACPNFKGILVSIHSIEAIVWFLDPAFMVA